MYPAPSKFEENAQPMKPLMRRFARDEEGGLIVFSILVLVSMLVLGGMAVDFMRQENERIVLQGITDRSVLSGASLQQELAGDALVLDYFAKSGRDGAVQTTPFFEDEGNSKRVSVDAQSEIDTFFLRLIGIDQLSAVAGATAIEAAGKVEISLVIDVSGSMRGQGSNPKVTPTTLDTGGRINDLRNAAKAFASTVLDPIYEGQISLTIVPYAGHTNPGQDMFEIINGDNAFRDGDDNFDVPFDAIVPGEVHEVAGVMVGIPMTRVAYDEPNNQFVLVIEGSVESIPDIIQKSTYSGTYSGPYNFIDSDGDVVEVADASGVLQSIQNESIRAIVTEGPTDPVTGVTSYIPHTGYVQFNADPDDWVLNPGDGNVLEVVYDPPHACMELLDAANWTSTAPPAAGQPKVPQFMHWGYQDWEVRLQLMGHGWCPHNETSIRYAMQDAQTAVDYIDEVQLFDGTGTQNAVKWGVATLDPAMQPNFQALHDRDPNLLPADFVDRPAAFDDVETRKILVLMTDGRVTPQYRPLVGEEDRIENLLDIAPADITQHDDWIGDNIQGAHARQVVSGEVARDTQLVGMCNLAKADDKITIYTVAFEFPQAGEAGFDGFAANRTAMQNCATPDTGTDQYYYEAEGSDLTTVFQDIAEQISDLRLTR